MAGGCLAPVRRQVREEVRREVGAQTIPGADARAADARPPADASAPAADAPPRVPAQHRVHSDHGSEHGKSWHRHRGNTRGWDLRGLATRRGGVASPRKHPWLVDGPSVAKFRCQDLSYWLAGNPILLHTLWDGTAWLARRSIIPGASLAR
eukprot:gene2778-biopygen9972